LAGDDADAGADNPTTATNAAVVIAKRLPSDLLLATQRDLTRDCLSEPAVE
jgi:hypothetical protein